MKRVFFVLFLLLVPSTVFAQLVINPTKAQFTPSADHNTVENGVALVSNYELRIFQSGSTVVFKTVNLDKPAPDATNTITVSITSTIASLPLGDYFATVAAKGPGGEAVSDPSNPFQVAARPPTAPTNLRITK
jgi:hypothetical protein